MMIIIFINNNQWVISVGGRGGKQTVHHQLSASHVSPGGHKSCRTGVGSVQPQPSNQPPSVQPSLLKNFLVLALMICIVIAQFSGL